MVEQLNPFYMRNVDLSDIDEFLQNFLESNCVNSVSFSFTEYNPTDGTGLGTRTTIEKSSYEVEIFD